jgi:hypothetical protein
LIEVLRAASGKAPKRVIHPGHSRRLKQFPNGFGRGGLGTEEYELEGVGELSQLRDQIDAVTELAAAYRAMVEGGKVERDAPPGRGHGS